MSVGYTSSLAMPKEKKLISFAPDALKWLNIRAEELSISASEIVRRLVDKERERLAKFKVRR